MVLVYIWRFRKLGLLGFGNVGHAALEVRSGGPSDFYLSWWPGGDTRGGASRLKNKTLAHTTSHYMNFGYSRWSGVQARIEAEGAGLDSANFLSDKEKEDREADAKYRFNLTTPRLLSELRMKQAFDQLHQGQQVLSAKGHGAAGEYSLVHANCSDAVAWVLERGNAATYVAKPTMRFFWTPTDIAKWCDRLVIALNDKQPGSATRVRGFTGNDLDFTAKGWQYNTLAT